MLKIKRKYYLAVIVSIVAVLGVISWQHFHESHSTSHDEHNSSAKLDLNDGKKWQTDAAMRQAMHRIRELVAPLQAVTSEQSINPAEAKSIALGVQEQVKFMIDNCKLDKKADAVLHTFIADLLKATEWLSQEPPTAQGIVLIQKVLDRYPQYFEHPGWANNVENQPKK